MMRAIRRVLVPCGIVALAASCAPDRLVSPPLRTIGPEGSATAPGITQRGVPLSGVPGDCPNDAKLLNGGPTAVFGEGPGTWWGLIIHGLDSAGFVTDAQKIAYLDQVFGQSFASLDEAEQYNLQLVSDAWDLNQNGYICAYELRGTRAHFDDPLINITFFGITDDKIRKK
jgi:hypothetical protein